MGSCSCIDVHTKVLWNLFVYIAYYTFDLGLGNIPQQCRCALCLVSYRLHVFVLYLPILQTHSSLALSASLHVSVHRGACLLFIIKKSIKEWESVQKLQKKLLAYYLQPMSVHWNTEIFHIFFIVFYSGATYAPERGFSFTTEISRKSVKFYENVRNNEFSAGAA